MEFTNIEDVIADLKKRPIGKKGHLYHPIPFPEFSSLKTSSNDKEAKRKLDLIVNIANSYFDKGKIEKSISTNAIVQYLLMVDYLWGKLVYLY